MTILRLSSIFVVLPLLIACGGSAADDQVSIGKTKSAVGGELKQGDECPAEKCEGEVVAGVEGSCAPESVRCVAGPQEGSGVGVCHLEVQCALREGDICPAEKCANEAVANKEGCTPASTRCVAGPQVGSGVGVCHLDVEWSTNCGGQ